MKLLGLFMIFCSVSCVGIYHAQKQNNVLKSIKNTEEIITKMIFYIKNEHTKTDDIFEKIKNDSNLSIKIFIENLTAEKLIHASQIAEECDFSVDKTVLSIISDVFGILGRYSAEEQIKEMELAREKLENYYRSIESIIKTKSKLLTNSGFLCGILAVILLI